MSDIEIRFDVEGMTCASCAVRIERVLGKQAEFPEPHDRGRRNGLQLCIRRSELGPPQALQVAAAN